MAEEVTYSLDCGAMGCRHNIGMKCVRLAKDFGHETLTLDFKGRCIHHHQRPTWEERNVEG